MAIQSTRYAGAGANTHDENAGTSTGAATVLTGCSIAIITGGKGQITKNGHGYTWEGAGKALYVKDAGGEGLTEGIYEIIEVPDANHINIASFPGNANNATVRLNGLWSLTAAGIGAVQHGPNAGDQVRVYDASAIAYPAGGWQLNKAGTQTALIHYIGADASWNVLATGYQQIIGSTASTPCIKANATDIVIERFWADQQDQTGSYGIRLFAKRTIAKNCKATDNETGFYAIGAARAVFCECEASNCVDGMAVDMAVVTGCYLHDCTRGIRGAKHGVYAWNTIRDCSTAAIEFQGDHALGYVLAVQNNSIHGCGVGLSFTADNYGLVALVRNNIFDTISGYAIDGANGTDVISLVLDHNAYRNCTSGHYDSNEIGGVDLDADAVTLTDSPFVDEDNGDFSLVAGCEAIGAGTPAYADIGAVPHIPRAVGTPNMTGGTQ